MSPKRTSLTTSTRLKKTIKFEESREALKNKVRNIETEPKVESHHYINTITDELATHSTAYDVIMSMMVFH